MGKREELERYEAMFPQRELVYNGLWFEARGPFSYKNNPTQWTMFRIQVPLDKKREAVLIQKHPEYANKPELDRYNASLVECVARRAIPIQKRLHSSGMSCVLDFPKIWTYSEHNEPTRIFLCTNRMVAPVINELMSEAVTVQQVIHIATEAAKAVQELSRRGYAHRNISPYSIYMDQSSKEICLGDFLYAAQEADTSFVYPLVDNDFIAPEVIAGGYGGLGADLYSIALILFCVFTGQTLVGVPDKNARYVSKTPAQIRNAINLGLQGNPANADRFIQMLEDIPSACPRECVMSVSALIQNSTPSTEETAEESDSEPDNAFDLADILSEIHSMDTATPYITQGGSQGLMVMKPKQTALAERKTAKRQPKKEEKQKDGTSAIISVLAGMVVVLMLVLFGGVYMAANGYLDGILNRATVAANAESEQPIEGKTEIIEEKPEPVVVPAPSGITMLLDGTSIVVSWDGMNNVSGYTLEYADNSTFTAAESFDTKEPTQTIPDHEFVDNYVRIRAYVTSQDGVTTTGDWSDIAYISMQSVEP